MNRLPMVATVVAGVLLAGLPPAVATAATQGAGCAQWGFTGQTGVTLGSHGSEGSIRFSGTGPSIQQPAPASYMAATQLDPQGNPETVPPILGTVTGTISSGGQIDWAFTPRSDDEDGPTWQGNGQVNPDGTAHGDDWAIDSPLYCVGS